MSDLSAVFPLAHKLKSELLEDLKRTFVGKNDVIDLLGIGLVARENVFLHGPPGTAKSALVHELCRRLDGETFDYLLTRFTEPNELFGPFDIRRLREGELVTNTAGMLPEAAIVFLDELLNANSAILNSLLMVLNERIFRRGSETRAVPALMIVGASNHLPEEEALQALFDRFLLRVRCDNIDDAGLMDVLVAGWKLEADRAPRTLLTVDEVRRLQAALPAIDLTPVLPAYLNLIGQLRQAGITVSDRRAVKLQRAIAASALICERAVAKISDLWVLRHLWDTTEQIETLVAIVQETIGKDSAEGVDHPRSRAPETPHADGLARDLDELAKRIAEEPLEAMRDHHRDLLTQFSARVEWVPNATQRDALREQVEALWKTLGMP